MPKRRSTCTSLSWLKLKDPGSERDQFLKRLKSVSTRARRSVDLMTSFQMLISDKTTEDCHNVLELGYLLRANIHPSVSVG